MVADVGRVWTPLRLSGLSAAWGTVIVSAAFWFPAYSTAVDACRPGRTPECETVREGSSTLVAVDGVDVVYWLMLPAIASALVGVLAVATPRGGQFPVWLAWCVVGALWAVSLIAGASIGLYFVPSAILLTFAVRRMHAALPSVAVAE